MGFVSDAVGGLVGGLTGETASDAAHDASKAQRLAQQEALDYIKERDEIPQQFSDAALTRLGGFYGLGDDPSAGFDAILDDPFVQSQIQSRQAEASDAILRSAAATGGLRSGNVQDVLSQQLPQVQQQVVNEYLTGLQGMAGLETRDSEIANLIAGIGQTRAQGIAAQGQAKQDAIGNLIQIGTSAAGMFSDRALKDDIEKIGESDGINIYKWIWNETANRLGLSGEGVGVIADEVEKTHPAAVTEVFGYKRVNYNMIGLS